jgi:hypothetical protein
MCQAAMCQAAMCHLTRLPSATCQLPGASCSVPLASCQVPGELIKPQLPGCHVPLARLPCARLPGAKCQAAKCHLTGVRCQLFGTTCQLPGVRCQGASCHQCQCQCHPLEHSVNTCDEPRQLVEIDCHCHRLPQMPEPQPSLPLPQGCHQRQCYCHICHKSQVLEAADAETATATAEKEC